MNEYVLIYENWDKPERVICSQSMMHEIILALADWSGTDSDEVNFKYADGKLLGAEFKDDCGNQFYMHIDD